MSFTPVMEIKVGLKFGSDILPIGRLARRDQKIYFEYADTFLDTPFEISPYHLPVSPGVKTFDLPASFEGLPGVFADSLPDGWGRLLLDRSLRSQGIQPGALSALDRLAYVGPSGMGALVYEPDQSTASNINYALNLDQFATQTRDVMSGQASDVLQDLIALNGSSAGARPKAMITLNADKTIIRHGAHQDLERFDPWVVKFANNQDGADTGAIEYVYGLMAKSSGIEMTETHLFPAKYGAGYFATKRFDRTGVLRIHMLSACGLLHSDFRTPVLEYEDILGYTQALTKDIRQVEKIYRIAVFNVLSHNRDDHSKNFSFLMDEAGEWQVSPAYDLTFSSGPNGYQSTTVMGEGERPDSGHLRHLADAARIAPKKADAIIEQTRDALSAWSQLAKTCGVFKENIALIKKLHITSLLSR